MCGGRQRLYTSPASQSSCRCQMKSTCTENTSGPLRIFQEKLGIPNTALELTEAIAEHRTPDSSTKTASARERQALKEKAHYIPTAAAQIIQPALRGGALQHRLRMPNIQQPSSSHAIPVPQHLNQNCMRTLQAQVYKHMICDICMCTNVFSQTYARMHQWLHLKLPEDSVGTTPLLLGGWVQAALGLIGLLDRRPFLWPCGPALERAAGELP